MAEQMEKRKSTLLTQLIREEVKAQMKRYVMAKQRDDFINRLVDALTPAFAHHYRATLGTVNNRTDQVEKWRRQEEGFLHRFMDRLTKPIKAKGLDRKKAVEQALKEVMETDVLRRRVESQTFQRTYDLKRLSPLPADAHEDILARVRAIVDAAFPPRRGGKINEDR